MRITQRFGVAGGNPVTMQIRYYDIQPDRFSWTADQSKDGGKTWTKDYLTIEARADRAVTIARSARARSAVA